MKLRSKVVLGEKKSEMQSVCITISRKEVVHFSATLVNKTNLFSADKIRLSQVNPYQNILIYVPSLFFPKTPGRLMDFVELSQLSRVPRAKSAGFRSS